MFLVLRIILFFCVWRPAEKDYQFDPEHFLKNTKKTSLLLEVSHWHRPLRNFVLLGDILNKYMKIWDYAALFAAHISRGLEGCRRAVDRSWKRFVRRIQIHCGGRRPSNGSLSGCVASGVREQKHCVEKAFLCFSVV